VNYDLDKDEPSSTRTRNGFDAESIILNHIDQGVIVRDTGGQIIFANVTAANIFGYQSADELLATPFPLITQHRALFDNQGNPVELEAILNLVEEDASDEASALVQVRRAAEPGERWFRVRVRPVLSESGSDALTVGVWEDVTDRRKAGERNRLLAAIVATSDDAIVSKTLDGTVTSWNLGAERLFGWSAEEMIGQSIARIVPPDKLEELASILARLANGEHIDHYETARITRDGRRLDVSVSISPLLDNEGRVIGAAKIGRDITLRREAERFADAFLADLAHDVNNPLATARLQAQLLRRRLRRGPLEAEKADESLAAVETSIAKVVRRINELSDISRLRLNGKLDLRLTSFDLNDVITNVVQSMQQRDRVAIESASPQLIGTWDAERLERVFDNLVTNALKYSGAETTVTVKLASEQSGDSSRAIVQVIDSGIGIPEVDLPHIFDRFRRGSNVVGRFAGTGIGLAGTRQILELLGGEISIESKTGVGTTVTVRLPFEPPSQMETEDR